jgi:hypothetical protein
MSDKIWPFDRHIHQVGVVLAGAAKAVSFHLSKGSGEAAVGLYKKLSRRMRARKELTWMLLLVIADSGAEALSRIGPTQLKRAIAESEGQTPASLTELILAQPDSGTKWLPILEEIGHISHVGFYSNERLNVEGLTTLLQQNYSSPGLLRLTAIAISQGATVPARLKVRAEEFDEARSRQAAALIELAQGRFNQARAGQLAGLVTQLRPSDLWTIQSLVEQVGGSGADDLARDHFLAELFQGLHRELYVERGAVLKGLGDALRRRKSDLLNPTTWGQLGLPPKLLAAASTPL